MSELSAARIFEQWFLPLYPPELRDPEALAEARVTDANPARNPQLFAQLEEIADIFARLAPAALGKDDLALDFSDASVHRLGAAVDRSARDRLMAQGEPLTTLVVHGAIYLGACVVKHHGGVFSLRRPMWESVVTLQSRAGRADLAPFHWWLRALSDAEIDKGGLSSRYRQYVERPTVDALALPKLVRERPDRALPPLRTVRYDLLHKYLRAHLPELVDLGRDFPSPEELHALGLLELELMVLGEGRMVLMHGRGKRGLHLFWLDHQGFSQAAYFPATPGDPHSIEQRGDILIVRFRAGGTDQTHEILWWG